MCIAEKLFGVRGSRSAEAILPRHPGLVLRAPGVCRTTSRNILIVRPRTVTGCPAVRARTHLCIRR